MHGCCDSSSSSKSDSVEPGMHKCLAPTASALSDEHQRACSKASQPIYDKSHHDFVLCCAALPCGVQV